MPIPIAALHPNFPYAGYKLEPNAQIFLVKGSGHVTAVLNATTQLQGGRWVQVDDNWSLQNLLALGFERLTRQDVCSVGRRARASGIGRQLFSH
jgi:hypothetical protein